ncbi:hypothetical protein REPUB_Repub12eG0206500 [Reevesia pubescens]
MSLPQAIPEMGFVHFEENQVLSFLAPAQSSLQIYQHLNTATNISNSTNSTTMGFSHNNQVGNLDPKAVNDKNCPSNAHNGNNYSWWRSAASEKDKVKVRRKLREPRFCFQTRSEVYVLDNGYKWRKYRQKVVINSLHPRFRYHGCLVPSPIQNIN